MNAISNSELQDLARDEIEKIRKATSSQQITELACVASGVIRGMMLAGGITVSQGKLLQTELDAMVHAVLPTNPTES